MRAKYIEIEHPGVILKEEFLDPLNLTQSRLAQVTGIPKGRISEIIHGKRDVTAETGIRISRALGLSDGFFMACKPTTILEKPSENWIN